MEAWGRAFGGLDLCHIGGVVEFAVGEDELEGGKVIEGEGRVFGEEEEVGAFADLDGADIVLKPDVLGTVEGGGAQDLEGRVAALGECFHFPVIAESLELSVCAEENQSAGLCDLSCGSCDTVMMPLLIHDKDGASASDGIEESGREEAFHARIVPDGLILVEVVFARDAAIGDKKRGGVTCLAACEKLYHVAIERNDGESVFDAGVSVEDHAKVHFEMSATFGEDEDLFFVSGADHPLALLSSGLHIAFDRECAEGFEASDVLSGIFKAADHCFLLDLGSVEDEACGEDARPDGHPCADTFCKREDQFGTCGRIVCCGHAIRKVGVVFGDLLRVDIKSVVMEMGVCIDKSGGGGLPFHVDDTGIWGNGDRRGRSHRKDVIALGEDRAVGKDALWTHCHDTKVCEGEFLF